MNKVAIKKFAVESRQKLLKSVIERLEELGIRDKEVLELVEQGGVYTVKSLTLTETEKKNRQIILSKIEEKGYEAFVEEVAYTWFNRIIAIRYMEVNDYLPIRTRVLSSEIQGKVDPDIITEIADYIEELELNRDKVLQLKEQNKQEELFKYVFIKVCNYLGQFLPVMFEQIEDYTELLLPSVMISNGSVIKDMIELVPEEDWTNQVEIIGWLYQYYISEKKDQVFADLKKNKKITKENIPAATQLFTPEWIVKYMVENSLGRLWLEGHPNEELKSKWKYYLEEAEQEDSVKIGLEKIKKESEILTPEDLTIIDPAMGSGHILVYAFDVLYQIYLSAGYSEREIPRLILEKNIYGLDIDDRAGQLAYFALMMKARSYSRRIFRDMERNPISLNVCSIQESNGLTNEDIEYFANGDESLKKDIEYLVEVFTDAKEYGSILEVKEVDFEKIENRLVDIEDDIADLFSKEKREIVLDIVSSIVKQGKVMSNKYYACVTNPPYMGGKGQSAKLVKYLKKYYDKSKLDLCTTFIEVCKKLIKHNGKIGMITMHSWMFLNGYTSLREYLLNESCIESLIHIGTRGFEEISGEVVQTVTWIMSNKLNKYNSSFYDLTKGKSSLEKKYMLLNKENLYECSQQQFKLLPNYIYTYWISKRTLNIMAKNKTVNDYGEPKTGLGTNDNDRFLRLWQEVELNNIGFGIKDTEATVDNIFKWYPYNKGGTYKKWYGNLNYIVNWENDGAEIKEYAAKLYVSYTRTVKNIKYYFKEGITWSAISSSGASFRYVPNGFIFDSKGPMCFTKNIDYMIGLLNSKVSSHFLDFLAPTLDINAGSVAKIPYIENSKSIVEKIVNRNKKIAKIDWDSFEASWDFKKHPIIEFKSNNIENSFNNWSEFTEKQFNQLKANEEELNRIFIDIYGLQEELTPEVDDKDITIRKSDRERDIKSFISYAVGCMMGRYSLDEEGLIFAGGEFDSNKYETFKADEDGILLISDTEYFEDDLLNRFVEFVKVVYGEETLEENLNFIADTECFKRKATESSRDCLRRYFLKGFMEDHLKVYQKRPIYWMFDSGKQNGFKALIYLHRYNQATVAKVRTDYLHHLQRKYEAELERLDQLINFESISASEKGKAKKRQEQIHKQLDECTQYDLLLAHVAHQRISLDLDDGVKVNYQKFQNIELTTDGSSKAKKGDLLYKVKM